MSFSLDLLPTNNWLGLRLEFGSWWGAASRLILTSARPLERQKLPIQSCSSKWADADYEHWHKHFSASVSLISEAAKLDRSSCPSSPIPIPMEWFQTGGSR